MSRSPLIQITVTSSRKNQRPIRTENRESEHEERALNSISSHPQLLHRVLLRVQVGVLLRQRARVDQLDAVRRK